MKNFSLFWKCATAAGVVLTVAAIGLQVRTGVAYERYNDGCADCHGDFRGPISPKGTIFPGDDKHQMHRSSSSMDTECELCHMAGGFSDPFTGQSEGFPDLEGVGCTGCHGRDYAGVGNSGVGLRLHHDAEGISSCLGCHDSDPPVLPENVAPLYYGSAYTLADDPCNEGPAFLENWSIGDTEGLDNDGDTLYDTADPDCGVPCPEDIDGNGTVDILDLLAVLANWGMGGGPADVNDDGVVDILDLLAVLGAWGPC